MNVAALLGLMVREGSVTADPADEVIDGSAVVLDGEVRSAAAREALGGER
jgi:hypothetical protein